MSRRRVPLALARPAPERSPRTTAHGSRLSRDRDRDRDRRLTLPSFRPASRSSGPALGGSRSARPRRSRGDGWCPALLRFLGRAESGLLAQACSRNAFADLPLPDCAPSEFAERRSTSDDRLRTMPSPGHAGPGPRRRSSWNGTALSATTPSWRGRPRCTSGACPATKPETTTR
jgi:hypothetical protein